MVQQKCQTCFCLCRSSCRPDLSSVKYTHNEMLLDQKGFWSEGFSGRAIPGLKRAFPLGSVTCGPASCAGRPIRSKGRTSSAIQGANYRSRSVQLVPQAGPTENNAMKPLPLYISKTRKTASLPVAQERAQQHQAVLHAGDDLWGAVSSQEELSTGLKAAECQCFVVPLIDDLFQLLFNVPLLHCADADVLSTREALVYSRKATCLINSLSPEEPLLALSCVFKASTFPNTKYNVINGVTVYM